MNTVGGSMKSAAHGSLIRKAGSSFAALIVMSLPRPASSVVRGAPVRFAGFPVAVVRLYT